MFCCKEVKLLYATIVLLLEAELLVNTGAMESKRSSILAQNADELKSLELCISRNQQRLGSVFGNYTRHHKKGHRRRTTTTTQTTVIYTTVDNEDDLTNPFTTTETLTTPHPKLPKPQRLSSHKDYDVHLDKNAIEDEISEIIEEYKHHEKYSELEETSLAKSLSKVKKMYRDSAGSAANKLSGKTGKTGIFLTDNCTTVIAQIGTTAVLHCEVSDITENTVTWIRKKDYSLLSVGLVTYSADNRFFSAHGRHVKDWALHIRFSTSADGGYYECQVPTHPPTSIFFKLVLVAAYAEIMGESEKIIHEGSMLRLVCVVRRSTEPPSYVFWYFENRMINYDLNGVSVHNGRQTSELVIGKAEPRHAGNYTCVPANAKAASVTVHVVQNGVSVHNGRQTSELVIGKAEPRHAGNYTCVPANAKAASVTVHVVQNGVSVHNGRQTSELVIGKAEPRHAGNYTCVPANAKAASVTVHVVQSETPAAMQHGNNSADNISLHLLASGFAYLLALRLLLTQISLEYG